MAKPKTTKPIDSYAHTDKERTNNPPAGLVTAEGDPDLPAQTYEHPKPPPPPYSHPADHDPHIDPRLNWAGKTEGASFAVPTVSLHVHERIDPRTIMEAVRKRNGHPAGQESLFETEEENPPLRQAIEFYQHPHNWSNRLVAGDSLLVMNSLLEKESLGGQVQMIYIDPPYGIKYGSNFQPFVNEQQVTDGKDDQLTAEPEMIKAFRDTWEMGIHSYLSYLRDRLLLSRELLSPSGSCFVQIGDENILRVGLLMDEIFGAENRVTIINYATTGGSSAKTLPDVSNYLLWYVKDKHRIKYRQLYEPLTRPEIVDFFTPIAGMVELSDGTTRKLTKEEQFDPDRFLPQKSRLFQRMGLSSQGWSYTGRSEPYEWNGIVYHCRPNSQWSVSEEGMDRLAEIGRLDALNDTSFNLRWKWYEEEVPGRRINNIWHKQMQTRNKRYVVETARSVIARCMLMTTDPGDLVLDTTCGGGTTAVVAEQWGRRWITCDTSRVALTLTRQRLMTSVFDYYKLAQPDEGVGSGFVYKTVPKVSARILAYDEPPQVTTLYDQPLKDTGKTRVTGPFTMEAVPAPAVLPLADPLESLPPPSDASVSRSRESVRQVEWRDELLKTGLRGTGGNRIELIRLEPLPLPALHAEGETDDGSRLAVSFGPEHSPLETRQVERAIEDARTLAHKPELLVFAAFMFDPEAAKDIEETNWPGVTLLRAQMNADLLTADLKKARSSNESFWLVGQPDVHLERTDDGRFLVEVLGFDYFDTRTGQVTSGGADKIAVWMLDPDYDGRSLFPRQVFFPLDGTKKNGGWNRLAKTLRAQIDQSRIEAYRGTVSLPFPAGEHRRVAVKVVDDRGVESLRLLSLDDRAG